MKYIKKFNESNSYNSKIEEIEFDENMMVTTLTPLSILRIDFQKINIIGSYIIENLNNDIIKNKFGKDFDFFYENPRTAFNFFTTSIIDEKDLKKMFNNVVIHPGSDDEDEYVSALKIDGILTLLLHSPERGSQIRLNELLSPEGMFEIYKVLVHLYNKNLSN
jgi:hypothetical protein